MRHYRSDVRSFFWIVFRFAELFTAWCLLLFPPKRTSTVIQIECSACNFETSKRYVLCLYRNIQCRMLTYHASLGLEALTIQAEIRTADGQLVHDITRSGMMTRSSYTALSPDYRNDGNQVVGSIVHSFTYLSNPERTWPASISDVDDFWIPCKSQYSRCSRYRLQTPLFSLRIFHGQ